jgi:hypothetical protein
MRSIGLVGCWLVAYVVNTATVRADPAPGTGPDPAAPETAPPPLPLSPPTTSSPIAPPSSVAVTPPPPLEAPREAETEPSYRWQIGVADASSLALLFTVTDRGALAGGLLYLLGGPIIHAVHGEPGRAVGSLGLRVALPVAGAFVGGALWWNSQDARCKNGDPDYCSDDEFNVGALYGLGLGFLGAMVIDTAVLARPVPLRKDAGATWAPQLAVAPGHLGVGVVGRF